MRTRFCLGLAALLLTTACPGDDGSGADTGGDTDTDPTSSDPTSMTSPSTSASSTDPSTTDPSTTEPTSTTDGTTTTDPMTTTMGTTSEESSSTTMAPDFTITSPQFVQDGTIPTEHHSAGGNIMPAFDWVGAPPETQSFGIFMIDLDFNNYRHSGIWNISADADGTPLDVEHEAFPASVPGAVQCRNWMGEFGYGGPGSASNTYQFTLYALDVDDLSGEIDENSSLAQVQAALEDHAIETTAISAQTAGPP